MAKNFRQKSLFPPETGDLDKENEHFQHADGDSLNSLWTLARPEKCFSGRRSQRGVRAPF